MTIQHDNKDIAQAFSDAYLSTITFNEAKELLEVCEAIKYDSDYGAFFEFGGEEFRVIDESDIDMIWTDSLIEQIKDSYGGLSDLPSFISMIGNKQPKIARLTVWDITSLIMMVMNTKPTAFTFFALIKRCR